MRKKASILVGLLWCVALLSVIVIGVLHTAQTDLVVVKNYGDRIQAHYLALAGIEKAKALLYQNALQRSHAGKSHTGELFDAADQFRDVAFGRGRFRVMRLGRQDEGGGLVYGVSDEESRLNVNCASAEQLAKLDGMTTDVVAAILDWRDADNEVTPGGAEADYYASLKPPYQPRNGPFQTIRELLMVRGVSRELLLGTDFHENELPEITGDGDNTASGTGNVARDLVCGWAGLMTVDSLNKNVNAAGQDRVNMQSADEATLTTVRGITPQIARAIVAYRGQKQFQSIADLLDVTAPQTRDEAGSQGSSRRAGRAGVGQSQSGPSSQPSDSGQSSGEGSGPRVINEDLFLDIADDVSTVDGGQDLPGVININTASLDVLACLPGVERDLAQAIISYRQSNGFFPNVAWLLKVPGMTLPLFKQLAPLVSARSETFRILSEGRINSTGTRQRIRVIVHIGFQDITTVSFREDDL